MARQMLRDSKGRFISNKNATKNNSNKKENDIMMNRTNAKEKRMEALKANGYNVDNFFNLSLQIPFGAEVKLVVDGKEMIFGQNNGNNGHIPNVNCGENIMFKDANGMPIAYGMNYERDLENDPIVKNILQAGYVYNPKTDGRWVAAQTFRMINERSYNWKTRQYETGWDAYLRNCYGFMYQFDMMVDELHRLAKMERSNDIDFYKVSRFFTKTVVVDTCEHYIRQLKKYIKKQPTRKCKGVPYVKLNNYGNVFIKYLNEKIYSKFEYTLLAIRNAKNYTELEKTLKNFMWFMVKLPYDTPKCPAWKDAFKGIGSYKTLNNIIKHHNCVVQNYETGEILDRDNSLIYIDSLLDTYANEYWKYHELLKATIELNKFDLKKSIETQRN